MKQANHFAISSLAAVAAAIALAACGERVETPNQMGQQGGDSSMAQGDRSTGSTTGAAPAANDATVSAAVKAAIANDAQLQAVKVDVEASGGKVTLKGSAPDSTARDHAGQVVASVRGVTAVDNQITVAGS
jgi:hyperosmotically inducible protein